MMRNRGGSMNKSEIGEDWVVIWKHPSISLPVVLPEVFLLERCMVSMAAVTSTVLNPSCSISVLLWLAWLFGISAGFNSASVLIPCKVSLETVKFVSLWKSMDPRDPGHIMDSELVANESEDSQRMFIRVYALSSTVYFALETLVQHGTLIGQLQDEVFALRIQNEELLRRLDQREETRVQLSSSSSARIVSEASVAPIPDLNEPLVKD